MNWHCTPQAIRVILIAFLIATLATLAPARADEPPSYVGSAICASCHVAETARWSGSDHHNAWTLPSDQTVLGDFSGVTFSHGGITSRFYRDGSDFYIETADSDGALRAFRVVGVAGIDPLQQYLLEPKPGRTQVFDIGWDIKARKWYPVFPDQHSPPGDGLHWTGPYKSWEARCAECHATGYTRNYHQDTRTYSPMVAEIGVGCEACHGPGSQHLAWAEKPGSAIASGLTAVGLTADLGASDTAEIQQCFTCHSLREANVDGNIIPGTNYHDAYSISLLREGSYHPDGSILGEVYEAGSFLQSKMHAMGVRCSDCHDPHSMQLTATGNDVCTQCHSPAGNTRFKTLPLKVFDGPEHTFHPAGSAGAQCVSCHMIQRTYMGIDRRRDHSFRIPRPDLASTGSPDACTDCHADNDPAWAAAQIEGWYPDSRHRGPHFATTFAAARKEPGVHDDALIELAEWDGPAIVRASALELMGPLPDEASANRVAALLSDIDPIVREGAARALVGADPAIRADLLVPALSDPIRTVRIAAAQSLLGVSVDPASAAGQNLGRAMGDWQAGVLSRTDFPETNLQIAGAAMTLRNLPAALAALGEAVTLDPQLEAGWVAIIRILAATGDTARAQAALTAALAAIPASPTLLAVASDLGLSTP